MITHKALKHLSKSDPKMLDLIKRIKFKPKLREDHFRGLTESIIGQQLSEKAGGTIVGRFWTIMGRRNYTHRDILKTPVRKLRSVGMSGSKARFIKGLALALEKKKINLKALDSLSDDEVVGQLTKLKGIGKWTAEMFLIFSLGRPDIFSLGDVGLRNAVRKLYGLKKNPSEKILLKISKPWSPHRSAAALYLWASLNNTYKQEEPER